MGYVFATSACFGCGETFTYNPVKVPSIRIDGVPQPVCGSCIALANPKRIANGLDPIEIHPDAYEACDEAELS
jgi:hypothetical protein